MTKTTALFTLHRQAKARFVEFAGWEMPLQFSGIIEEHKAVRESVGIFDISHMGEIFVRGSRAEEWLDEMLTNRVANLTPGRAQYSMMLNEGGGVLDDLYVYRLSEQEFLLVVNASCVRDDFVWLSENGWEGVIVEDASARLSAVAVQGPSAPGLFEDLSGRELPAARNRVERVFFGGSEMFVCTTGYTGEAGFEVICPNEVVGDLWVKLVTSGATPCGLGARDILRLEMGFALNGSDLNPSVTPLEAGLSRFVVLGKHHFIGAEVIRRQAREGTTRRLAGYVATADMPPIRPHYAILREGLRVGETTSGGVSPCLGKSIGMGYLPVSIADEGQILEVDVRGRAYPVQVVSPPFLKLKK